MSSEISEEPFAALNDLHIQNLSKPISIIDIGSNSVRLVVFEAAKRSPAVLFNEKVLCGLGQDIMSTGNLNLEAIKRAVTALQRFKAISDQIGAAHIYPVATAATRKAKNSAAFIDRIEKICEHPLRILSGEEEAEIAAKGVLSGVYKPNGIVVDMGGGSLEIIEVKNKKTKHATSVPLGSLSLLSVSQNDKDRAQKFVRETLETVDWLQSGKDRTLYAIGGTFRALAKLHISHINYPMRMIHEYVIKPDDALNFFHLIYHLSPASLSAITGLNKARRDTVPYGAAVFKNLINLIQPSEIMFSSFGVREGLLFDLLSEEEQTKDPLLAACLDLCTLRSRSVGNTDELFDWTGQLFETAGLEESKKQKRLRKAACLLSDIVWRTHPEYRGPHALNVIAQGAFSGISHEGRAFLALCIFFRHEGRVKPCKLPEISKLLDEESLKRALLLGLSLRVGHMISASTPNVLTHTPLVVKAAQLMLNLPKPYDILYGEKLERRLTNLAEVMGLEPYIQYDTKSYFQKFLGF